MTTEAIADLLGARRIGPGRYQGRCPAHDDHSPSLSIREGDDGRTLLLCRAGCDTADVLAAMGLRMRDLFAGRPLSCKRAAEAALKRRIVKDRASECRGARRLLAHRYRTLNELVDAIGIRLAKMPEGRDGDGLAKVFHTAIDKVAEIETIYEQLEARDFHERLVRLCELHRIEREDLLARYRFPDDEGTEAAP